MPAATPVPDRVIWVSPDGNDNNIGSEDAPVRSIQLAMDRATPGTAIMIKPGDYTGNLEFQNVQGTTESPIWLVAAEGPGSVTITAETNSRAALTIQGEDNFVIRDLVLVGGANGIQINQSGKDFTDTVSNITLQGNTVIGAQFDGIKVGQTTNLKILNNTVDGAGDQGIDTLGVVNAVIDGNEIMNVTGTSGMFVKGGSSNVVVANNYVHDIVNGDGILVGGNTSAENFNPGTGYEAKNVVVTGNVVEDAFKRPLTVLGAQDVDIHGNFFGSMESNAHLVLVGAGSPELSPPPPSARVEIHDNVFDRSTNFSSIEQDASSINIHDNVLDGVVEGDIRPNPPVYGDEQFVDLVPDSVLDAPIWSTTARSVRSFTAGSGNQTLTGTSGNDSLSGGSGDDTTIGGAGDDTHTIGSSRDIAVENPGEGIDTAIVYVRTYTLPANIENLTVAFTSGGSYVGNGLNNIIRGGSGNDTLRGAAGDDLFVPSGGLDTITDFNAGPGNGDRVDLRGLGEFRDLGDVLDNTFQFSGDTWISIGNGFLTLSDVDTDELDADDFLFSPPPIAANAPPTAISLSNTALAEGSALGTVLGTLTTDDPDAGEVFTYTLLDDVGGRFAIDGDQIVVAGALDYETAPTSNLVVRVTDSAGNSFDQTFAISLSNVGPTAPVDGDGAANQVSESAAEGTVVGILASADEPGGMLTYSLEDSADGRFAIDPVTGVVTVKNPALLDFESAAEHTVTVRASDAAGAFSSTSFTIAITDDPSDTPPTGISLSNTTTAEGSAAGTVVGALAASDANPGETFTFSLVDDAGGRFAVDGDRLVVAGQLDYETAPSHQVTVRVTDSAGNFFDQTFGISLINIEPSTPIDAEGGANQVLESASNGTAVGIVASAQEVDGGAVTYSLADSAGGRFAIDATTGVVTVANAGLIDFETATEHTITVQASDASGASSTANFMITVGDDPSDTPPTDISLSNTEVAEGSPVGAVVGDLSALDADADESFVFSLINNPGGFFAVEGNQLVTAAALDFESVPTHNITVRVTDSDGNIFDENIAISVGNVGPSAPADADDTLNQISEFTTNGALVGITASAQEVDGGRVIYSLADSADGRFAINATTGVVTVANAGLINFENAAEYSVTVRARDASGAFSTASFVIGVADDPVDTPPTGITLSNDVAAEGSVLGTVVGSLAAVTEEAGGSFSFSLLEDAGGLFAIDGDQLVVAGELDYEAGASHEVTIRVSDSAGNFFDQAFDISLTNVAPSTPTDGNSAPNQVLESAAAGTSVGLVAFSEEVGDGTVTYSLDDSAGGRFAIDNATGVVTVANAGLIDFETAREHTITVRASDASGAFATENFVIAVADDPNEPITWPVSGAWTKSIVTGGGSQTVTGSVGNDFMDGGKGVDVTIGRTGDDTHQIQDAGDTIVENPGEGIDTARVVIRTFTLPDNVENLTVTYNSGGGVYVGNGLNNIMAGGTSGDTLTGGGGADLFVVSRGSDRITDFGGGAGFGDTIDLRGLPAIASLDDVLAGASQVGSDTVLNLASGHTLTLSNFDLADLVADDFLFAPQDNPVQAAATQDFMI